MVMRPAILGPIPAEVPTPPPASGVIADSSEVAALAKGRDAVSSTTIGRWMRALTSLTLRLSLADPLSSDVRLAYGH
jgi:hypothetical protein